MRRTEIEPWLWAAAAVLCLWALAWRPTLEHRPFQILVMTLALATAAVGGAVSPRGPTLSVPALLLAAWIVWQVAPAPPAWLGLLAPQRMEAVEAALAVGASPWTSLAADPSAAMRGGVMLAGLFALFALARAASASPAAGLLAGGLVAAGAVEAALGLEQYLSALHTGEAEAVARGTFVNRGQFAAFLLVAVGAGAGGLTALGERLRRRPEWAAAGLACAALLGIALWASMSRAALASAAVVGVTALLRSGRRALPVVLATGLLVAAGVTLTSTGARVSQRFERLARDGGDPGRLLIWRDSAPLAAEHAVWGAGPGGYGAVFQRASPYFVRKSVSNAHSDVLEAWIDLGAVGFLLLLGPIALLLGRSALQQASPLALGCAAGAAGPLLQSVVDLPLQSPAVAGAAACCLGLAAGPGRPRRAVSVAIAGSVAVAGLLAFGGVPPTAEQAFQRAELAWAAGDADAARAGWLETLSIQPREAAAWLRLSGLARAEGDLEQASRLARLADRWEPFTMRTQWALAEIELASGDAKAAVRRIAAMMQDAPDTRAAAIQALWRGGAELDLIEADMARSDGGAAGDFLAFLARAGLRAEMEGAYQRLVVERELQPAQAEAAYISRALADVSVGAAGRPSTTR